MLLLHLQIEIAGHKAENLSRRWSCRYRKDVAANLDRLSGESAHRSWRWKHAEDELRKAVEENDVFRSCESGAEIRHCQRLKKNGHVRSFLGYGVNDAPALKLADAGISVDSGVQVAKEASSVIVAWKSLGAVADGVAEGRKAFGNMIKYIDEYHKRKRWETCSR